MTSKLGWRTWQGAFADLVLAAQVDPAERERYARDPFAHLEDGHVLIPDLFDLGEVELHAWPGQVAVVEAWVDLPLLKKTGRLRFRNVHVEKSRQMGISWIIAWVYLWALIYHGIPLGYQHMNADEVDDGGEGSTIDSFFGRIRFMYERLPEQYQPHLRFRGGNNPSIRNRQNAMAYLRGEGATPNPGRGGRFGAWVFDEAAHLAWGEAAHKSISRAVPDGRLYNSTPEGEGNLYHRLRDERPENFTFVRIHWSEHPLYAVGLHIAGSEPETCLLCSGNQSGVHWEARDPQAHRYPGKWTSPWYDAAVVELTDEQVASELDIDYVASLPARVFREFSEDVHVLSHIGYDQGIPLSFAWDYGLDVTAVAILQNGPGELRQIGELEIGDSTPDEVVAALLEVLADLGVPLGLLTPHWTRQMQGIGDPAGDSRHLPTNRSLSAEYGLLGFSITSPKHDLIGPTITATKRLLMGRPKPYRVSASTCPRTIRHWKQNTWPVDRAGRRKPGVTKPNDDEHNHMMRALAYYVSYLWPAPDAADAIHDATMVAVENIPDRGLETGLRYDQGL